jgi:hypothetical protein
MSPHRISSDGVAGLEAALHALPPAVRRVWELVFTTLVTAVSKTKAAQEQSQTRG